MPVNNHQITSLYELIMELEKVQNGNYGQLASRLAIPKSELANYASYAHEKYTRNCLIRTEEYELLLLGWEPGQSTFIHGHGQQACWVYIVEGSFNETIYKLEVETGDMLEVITRKAFDGKTTYMDDDMGYHKLANVSEERGLSLHLYSKPIDQCMVYNAESKSFENLKLSYTKHFKLQPQ